MQTAKAQRQVSEGAAKIFYYGTRAFVALSSIIFLAQGNWVHAASAAGIFALMFLPGLVQKEYRVYIPFELDAAIVMFIFLTLFLGSMDNFYEMFPWWDKMLHFLSGFLLALVSFIVIYLFNNKRAGLALTPLFASFFAVCFSALLSVVWEIYEFSADLAFGFNMQRSGNTDTMGDLIVNLIAAVIMAIAAYLWMRRRGKLPLTPERVSRFQYQGRRGPDKKPLL